MSRLSTLKLSIKEIHLFILLIILSLLVCVNCYKAGHLAVGVPDYAITQILLLVLVPFASADLLIEKAKVVLIGGDCRG